MDASDSSALGVGDEKPAVTEAKNNTANTKENEKSTVDEKSRDGACGCGDGCGFVDYRRDTDFGDPSITQNSKPKYNDEDKEQNDWPGESDVKKKLAFDDEPECDRKTTEGGEITSNNLHDTETKRHEITPNKTDTDGGMELARQISLFRSKNTTSTLFRKPIEKIINKETLELKLVNKLVVRPDRVEDIDFCLKVKIPRGYYITAVLHKELNITGVYGNKLILLNPILYEDKYDDKENMVRLKFSVLNAGHMESVIHPRSKFIKLFYTPYVQPNLSLENQ